DVLVNNAGLAAGLAPIAEGDERDWAVMLETNVLGLLRVTRAFLPLLRAAPHAHIVNLGSIAGGEVYPGIQPLTADDVADCVAFVVTRPPHVDIDRLVVRPVAQAAAYMVARADTR
ncbi:MAG TPA: SDR family NAD(P)-dependent oxidoreductase, partial [Actinomycetota bacterium]|nr:SDR family NAD(P)-dependent oxidoreductase [Actinomycetota bacterium]